MTATTPFADVEVELFGYLAPKFSGLRFSSSLPSQIAVTTARIKRISGANRDVLIDRPIVDIDVYSPTSEADASTQARAIQAALLALAGTSTPNGVIARVATINGPRWLPTDNQVLTRYGATYEVFIRAA
jgi:hypothetical protein